MDEGSLTLADFYELSVEKRCKRYVELSDHDKFMVRLSMPPAVESPICNDCVHYRGVIMHDDDVKVACDAFPNGIPSKILDTDEHSVPYPGDHGIRFEAKKPQE